MPSLIERFEHRSRRFITLACLVFLAVVGIVDYLTGYLIRFSVFYLLPIGLATWYLGRGYGFALSLLSVVVWIIGDLAAGAQYSFSFIAIWNAAILLAFYLIVVWLLSNLRSLQRELEDRVRARTAALTQQMTERERLEKEILEVSEREQRRIGHDLHDSLCQHLTAAAMASHVLRERLAAKSLPEADDAGGVVGMIQVGMTMARDLAHGLSPVEMDAEGLVAALDELAVNISRWSRVECVFEAGPPVLIKDASAATHLYRIAQEAVSNALRHGKPKHIVISLAESGGRVSLLVEDDGTGLPDDWAEGEGLGTRIMAHRASMIGAAFSIEPNLTGGTLVTCSLPKSGLSDEPRSPSK